MTDLKRILFPTDFSSNANHALLHALRLADFHDGELIVQHVVRDYFEQHPYWSALFGIHQMQTELDGYVEVHVLPVLGAARDRIRITKVISKGEPSLEIARLADKEFVDLVVMGSAEGVHTNAVMRLTHRPVIAVSMQKDVRPEEMQTHKIKTVLVATDFSPYSRKVVNYAFDLKRAFDARIYMLHVIETPKVLRFGLRQAALFDTTDRMREWARNRLLNLTPDEFIGDANVVRIVEIGSAGARIAEVAGEIGADITIVGTHEYGAVRKRILGTTTDELLTTSTNPVLAVKL